MNNTYQDSLFSLGFWALKDHKFIEEDFFNSCEIDANQKIKEIYTRKKAIKLGDFILVGNWSKWLDKAIFLNHENYCRVSCVYVQHLDRYVNGDKFLRKIETFWKPI